MASCSLLAGLFVHGFQKLMVEMQMLVLLCKEVDAMWCSNWDHADADFVETLEVEV